MSVILTNACVSLSLFSCRPLVIILFLQRSYRRHDCSQLPNAACNSRVPGQKRIHARVQQQGCRAASPRQVAESMPQSHISKAAPPFPALAALYCQPLKHQQPPPPPSQPAVGAPTGSRARALPAWRSCGGFMAPPRSAAAKLAGAVEPRPSRRGASRPRGPQLLPIFLVRFSALAAAWDYGPASAAAELAGAAAGASRL